MSILLTWEVQLALAIWVTWAVLVVYFVVTDSKGAYSIAATWLFIAYSGLLLVAGLFFTALMYLAGFMFGRGL